MLRYKLKGKVGEVQNMKVWPENSVCRYGACTMNTVLNIGNSKQNHSSLKRRSSSKYESLIQDASNMQVWLMYYVYFAHYHIFKQNH